MGRLNKDSLLLRRYPDFT